MPLQAAVRSITPEAGRRQDVFLGGDMPEVFHPITHHNDVWKPDVFDVPCAQHEEARRVFDGLIHQAVARHDQVHAGRILLLLGESGCGKTHLMRVFRGQVHGSEQGYFAYMQMTSDVASYPRYILNNAINSLLHPYDEAKGPRSAIDRIAQALVAAAETLPGSAPYLEALRDPNATEGDLGAAVQTLAEGLQDRAGFETIDHDVLQAFLFFRRDSHFVRNCAIKYLRCEALSAREQTRLGGLAPRLDEDHPFTVLRQLAALTWRLGHGAFVLCLDQLEDMFEQDTTARERFRRMVSALATFADQTPHAVVLMSCLEDYYVPMSETLTASLRHRLEMAPPAVRMQAHGRRTDEETRTCVGRRLQVLYERSGAEYQPEDPCFPFPDTLVRSWHDLSMRRLLEACQLFREEAVRQQKIPNASALTHLGLVEGPPSSCALTRNVTSLERAWNDYLSDPSQSLSPPNEDEKLTILLCRAVTDSAHELPDGTDAKIFGHGSTSFHVEVTVGSGGSPASFTVFLCNRPSQGGGLAKQIREAERGAAGGAAVLTRSMEYPSNPATQVAKELADFLRRGGRRCVVQNNDWRSLLAFTRFMTEHGEHPDIARWRKEHRPLTRLPSIQAIFGPTLFPSTPRTLSATPNESAASELPSGVMPIADPALPFVPKSSANAPAVRPVGAAGAGELFLGRSSERKPTNVVLRPDDLCCHAGVLGGTGSGKTTLAWNMIEQLLSGGVPVVLLDRKGDLAPYADPQRWEAHPRASHVRTALYTPGAPAGRPLAMSLVPDGWREEPADERRQIAEAAAALLGGLLGYQAGKSKKAQAVLTATLRLLADEADEDVTLNVLRDVLHRPSASLLKAIGSLPANLCKSMAEDVQSLLITSGDFFAAGGETLRPDRLFAGNPGAPTLTVITTRFMKGEEQTLFWVSQFFLSLARWTHRNPSPSLRALLFVDEADLYLPAQGKPPTKAPLESLLKRARSAGLGLMLATQSPGDFDYKCRDNVATWLVGRVKEPTALKKIKPLWGEAAGDLTHALAGQTTGEFHVLRPGMVTPFRAEPATWATRQASDDEIVRLARATNTNA